VDLAELAAEVVGQLRPVAAGTELTISCRGACPSVLVDRRQLRRVLINLVGNAIKYTAGPGRIEVRSACDGSGATIAVADTGYGLSIEDRRRLFTRYSRFHRDRNIPGTGLGLYISRAIVEAHGGTIGVESTPGAGTTFTVRLPLRPA
jgi:signal transduction histidine kinase